MSIHEPHGASSPLTNYHTPPSERRFGPRRLDGGCSTGLASTGVWWHWCCWQVLGNPLRVATISPVGYLGFQAGLVSKSEFVVHYWFNQ